MQLSHLIKQYYKFGLWVFIIAYLCLAPADEFKKVHITIPYFDKMVHFGMFFILGLFIGAKKEYQLAATIYSWQIYFAAIYGGLIELAQSYLTTTRKGDWIDWLADLIGLALGIWMVKILPTRVIRLLA